MKPERPAPKAQTHDSELETRISPETRDFLPAFAATLCGYDPARAQEIAARPILFWRPGGKPGKRVYQTWEEVFTAFKEIAGPVVISADQEHGQLVIPKGWWDLQGRVIITGAHGVPSLWFAKDAHLVNARYSRVELKFGKKRVTSSESRVMSGASGAGHDGPGEDEEDEDQEDTDPDGSTSPWSVTLEKINGQTAAEMND